MPSAVLTLALGALDNVLLVLGTAFVLSGALPLLADRKPWLRAAALGCGFAVITAVALVVSVPTDPDAVGDLCFAWPVRSAALPSRCSHFWSRLSTGCRIRSTSSPDCW
jgi:hypothetical protein